MTQRNVSKPIPNRRWKRFTRCRASMPKYAGQNARSSNQGLSSTSETNGRPMALTVLKGCSVSGEGWSRAPTGSSACCARSASSRAAYIRPRGSRPVASRTRRGSLVARTIANDSATPGTFVPDGARSARAVSCCSPDTSTHTFAAGSSANDAACRTATPRAVSVSRNSLTAHWTCGEFAMASRGSSTTITLDPGRPARPRARPSPPARAPSVRGSRVVWDRNGSSGVSGGRKSCGGLGSAAHSDTRPLPLTRSPPRCSAGD